jgi:ATP phosphoribosyltransferase regulatory subunit
MLALRVDMTIGVARLVGTRLHDWPMPQRFCYAGSVFRDAEPRAGQQREFWQAGVELIGSAAPEADAEVLALTAHALRDLKLADFRIVVGQMHYFDGLLQALQLSPDGRAQLQQAIDRNSEAELAAFLLNTALTRRQQRALQELPSLSGSDVAHILARAERLCLNTTMHAAVLNLRAICAVLAAYDVLDHVSLDLTEIHNLGYYTGITFEALAPGVGYRLASGGRYDNLVGSFGPPQPAVGVAFGLERLLLALPDRVANGPGQLAPDVLVATHNDPACMVLVEHMRVQGLHVAVDLEAHGAEALWALAQRQDIAYAVDWRGDHALFSSPGHDAIHTVSRIDEPAILLDRLVALARTKRKAVPLASRAGDPS